MWNISEAFNKYITNEIICGGLSDKTKQGYQHTAKLVIEFLTDTTKIYTHYTNPQLRKIYEKAQEKC